MVKKLDDNNLLPKFKKHSQLKRYGIFIQATICIFNKKLPKKSFKIFSYEKVKND
jgi:hypothetical protein